MKREKDEEFERVESDLRDKLSVKDRHIMQIEEELARARLERDKFEK